MQPVVERGTDLETESRLHFRTCIVVLAGLPASGKTTLGRELARRTNIVFLDVDEARWELFPKPPATERLPDEITHSQMIAAYQRNHEKAQHLLSDNLPVALAATYSRTTYQEELQLLKTGYQIPLWVFFLSAPEADLEPRIASRSENDPSTVKTIEEVFAVRGSFQPFTNVPVVVIDTGQFLEENVRQILDSLTDLQINQPNA